MFRYRQWLRVSLPAVLIAASCFVGIQPVGGAAIPPDMDPAKYPAPNVGCLAPGKCHQGI